MKNKVVFLCMLVQSLILMNVYGADITFIYVTMDSDGTNIVRTLFDKRHSLEQFTAKIVELGRRENFNEYRLPVRFTGDVPLAEFVSTQKMLHSAGLTNLYFQLVSNPAPRIQANKPPIVIEIEDCSAEPAVRRSRLFNQSSINSNSSTNCQRNKGEKHPDPDDIRVDTQGL